MRAHLEAVAALVIVLRRRPTSADARTWNGQFMFWACVRTPHHLR